MEVINLEVRGAPPAESLCVPWGGMGATPEEEQGDAECWGGTLPALQAARSQPGWEHQEWQNHGKTGKKPNPKVLSSHKMRGGKSHPTPHPQPIQRVPVTPHLRLPPASIREAAGAGM